jgi:transposase
MHFALGCNSLAIGELSMATRSDKSNLKNLSNSFLSINAVNSTAGSSSKVLDTSEEFGKGSEEAQLLPVQKGPGKYLTAFQRKLLEKRLAQPDLPQRQRQRIQIMLMADQGKRHAEICQALDCCHATTRHWILMAQSGQAHNCYEQPMGRPKAISEAYMFRLKALVEEGPKAHGYTFRQWTASWLSKHLFKEFNIQVSDRHINRLLKQMGLSTRNAAAPNVGLPEETVLIEKTASDNNPASSNSKIAIQDLQIISPPQPAVPRRQVENLTPLNPSHSEPPIYGASVVGRATPLVPASHTHFWHRYLRGSTTGLSDSA